MAVPFRFFANPLGFKKSRPSWTSREPITASIESMQDQY